MEYHYNNLGNRSVYIEKNNGNIYIDDSYISKEEEAFKQVSSDLDMYTPSINPPIQRLEVDSIFNWIKSDIDVEHTQRVGLLYGSAGIGKSVVMHDLLQLLTKEQDYLVIGIKSDQFEFVDTEDLAQKLHLAKPLGEVIRSISACKTRVVLLIDQIDALSLSLSSNRTPLRSLLRLIQEIQNLENVRIVISCRPYDLVYDPILESLKVDQRWELKEFQNEEVKFILNQHHYTLHLEDEVLHFLGNPLHLHLFLKVCNSETLRFPLTEEDLYDELWRLNIVDVHDGECNRDRVIKLLDAMVNHMHNQQELTVQLTLFETEFYNEIHYLLHKEILLRGNNQQIQFFHQTMFDYVYARRFIESGGNILVELTNHHQGLFVRSEVKSILGFLRSSNPKLYKKVIKHILFDKDEYSKPIFRYHLRLLVLSSMAYFENPIPEEHEFIKQYLFADEEQFVILMDAIHNISWFKELKSIIDFNGGWSVQSDSIQNRLIAVCGRVLYLDSDYVINYLSEILRLDGIKVHKDVSDVLNLYEIIGCDNKLKDIYNQITTSRYPLQNCKILKSLVDGNPQFVIQELKTNIQLQVNDSQSSRFDKISLNHYESQIYTQIEHTHPELIVDFYLDLLGIILDNNALSMKGCDIKLSLEFGYFRRFKGEIRFNEFVYYLTNKILDKLESDIVNNIDYHEVLLKDLLYSDNEAKVFIGLSCYMQNPMYFRNSIFEILTSRQLLTNAPSLIKYKSAELLRVTFPNFIDAQKQFIVGFLMSIQDTNERNLIDKDNLNNRLQYGLPLFRIGLRKGMLLNLLPIDELKENYKEAYLMLLELKRKFHAKNLENTPPSQVSSMIGWPSMEQEQAMKMSNKDWISSMKAYTTNDSIDWNKPSLMGQLHLLENQTKQEPEKMFDLIMSVVSDSAIDLQYPIYGMKGFLQAQRYDLAEKVFVEIVKAIGDDINKEVRGYSLFGLLIALDGFLQMDNLPDSVFDFLCRVVLESHDDYSFDDEKDAQIYDRGINTPRGNAGDKLVMCSKYPQYADKIFNTLEQVAGEASVITRAAILFQLALLNTLDLKRSLNLFLLIMHDFHPKLMSLPVHRLNPLVYYVNFAFDDLVPFFEKAIKIETCYSQQVIILWLAWVNTSKDNAKLFLDIMCESSEDARLALLQFFYQSDVVPDDKACDFICHYMNNKYYSEKMADAYDSIFYNLKSALPKIQYRLAGRFIKSDMSQGILHCFYRFLIAFSRVNPMYSLVCLMEVLEKRMPDDYSSLQDVTDVLIQSYNGIKSFDDEENMPLLEKAMDLLDTLMQHPVNKYLINNFINKLDND